jgi:hypothetical protein
LSDNLIKIGAKVVSHGRYIIFQMAEVAIARVSLAARPEKREYSRQFGSHPGNPG